MKKIFGIILCVTVVLSAFTCGYIIGSKFIWMTSPYDSYIIISPYIKVETDKDIYTQGENVSITLYLVNDGKKDIGIQIFDWYYRTFSIYITNSTGDIVWNNPHFGLIPLAKPFNITINASASISNTYIWDQKEHVGGGCIVTEPGPQVSSGYYEVVVKLNLDREVYGNMTIEGRKNLGIE